MMGLNFLSSNLPGVFLRFFVVMYLEVPGRPEFLCSVHSRITCTLFALLFFAILIKSITRLYLLQIGLQMYVFFVKL